MRITDMITLYGFGSQIKKFSPSLLLVICGTKKGEFAVLKGISIRIATEKPY